MLWAAYPTKNVKLCLNLHIYIILPKFHLTVGSGYHTSAFRLNNSNCNNCANGSGSCVPSIPSAVVEC